MTPTRTRTHERLLIGGDRIEPRDSGRIGAVSPWHEESFGRALAVLPHDDEDRAVMMANDSAYGGLKRAVFTEDKDGLAARFSGLHSGFAAAPS